jgi:hypothetical protein
MSVEFVRRIALKSAHAKPIFANRGRIYRCHKVHSLMPVRSDSLTRGFPASTSQSLAFGRFRDGQRLCYQTDPLVQLDLVSDDGPTVSRTCS